MKKILYLLLLLGVAFSQPAQAQGGDYIVISVKTLSEKGNYEWEGLVSASESINNPELRDLLAELRKTQTDDQEDYFSSELENLKKSGQITEALYQQMKAQGQEAFKQLNKTTNAPSTVSNPAALKEKLRHYCFGKRFYREIGPEEYGLLSVTTGSVIQGKEDFPRFRGFIDGKGQIIIPPDRYQEFDGGASALSRLGVIVARNRDQSGKLQSARLIDKEGRVLVQGYHWLEMVIDYRLLIAQKEEYGNFGIIDYNGNVLEPFVYGNLSEALFKAIDRIAREKGMQKIEF